jgi:hypothetical protein
MKIIIKSATANSRKETEKLDATSLEDNLNGKERLIDGRTTITATVTLEIEFFNCSEKMLNLSKEEIDAKIAASYLESSD